MITTAGPAAKYHLDVFETGAYHSPEPCRLLVLVLIGYCSIQTYLYNCKYVLITPHSPGLVLHLLLLLLLLLLLPPPFFWNPLLTTSPSNWPGKLSARHTSTMAESAGLYRVILENTCRVTLASTAVRPQEYM